MAPSVTTTPNQAEETALIDCIVSGQASKFEILIGNYQQRIYASLLAMLGNRHDAEDVTQETFLTAFRKLEQFERRSSFYTWLHRIAFNAAIDLQRKKKRNRNTLSSTDLTETVESRAQDLNSPSSMAVSKETVCQVQIALSRLDEERRNIIVLRDMQGIDYAEIATVLGIPVGTVRSRLHRARIELREIMNAMGIGENPDQPNQTDIKNQMVTPGKDQR